MMNGSVIEVTEQEAQENFEFLFALVERGNTIKIVRKGGNVLMVPVPEREKLQMQQNFPPVPGVGNLPVDPAELSILLEPVIMSTNNSAKCRKNLNLDIKLWFSPIMNEYHWTLITYETDMNAGTAPTVEKALEDVHATIEHVMHEENDKIHT